MDDEKRLDFVAKAWLQFQYPGVDDLSKLGRAPYEKARRDAQAFLIMYDAAKRFESSEYTAHGK